MGRGGGTKHDDMPPEAGRSDLPDLLDRITTQTKPPKTRNQTDQKMPLDSSFSLMLTCRPHRPPSLPKKSHMHAHTFESSHNAHKIFLFCFGPYLEQRRRRGRRRKLQHFRRYRGQRGRIGVSYVRRCCLPSRRAVSERVSVVGERGIQILDITHIEKGRGDKKLCRDQD